jgi:selenide,water dikinase
LKFNKDKIPYIAEAKEYAQMGLVPGGAYRNKEYLKGKYSLNNVPEWLEDILFDPQTSGGLMFSCCRADGEKIVESLKTINIVAEIVGEVLSLEDKCIKVE